MRGAEARIDSVEHERATHMSQPLLVARGLTKQGKSKVDYDTLLQRLETLKASGSIPESAYAKLKSEYEERRRKG
jgi:hypothetical protein